MRGSNELKELRKRNRILEDEVTAMGINLREMWERYGILSASYLELSNLYFTLTGSISSSTAK